MATRYASLARCSELRERDVIAALISREECAALVGRIAASSPPRAGTRAVLGLLARLATPACAWLDGALAVELFEEEAGTKVRVMCEIGNGLRERVLPVVVLAQPLAEVAAVFAGLRELSGVLRIEHVSGRCALLLTSEDPGAGTQFEISETSLAWANGPAATLEDLDSGWDDVSTA